MTIYLGMMFAKIATLLFGIVSVSILFPFGIVCVVSGKWKLIPPVPDQCLSFYLATRSYGTNMYHRFYNINFIQSMSF